MDFNSTLPLKLKNANVTHNAFYNCILIPANELIQLR